MNAHVVANRSVWELANDDQHSALFAGAIAGDPALLNPAAFDLHLGVGSAAIDQGDALGVVPPVDFDGVARPQGKGIDIGAFEKR